MNNKLHWRSKMQLNQHLRAVCSTYQMPEEFSYYLLNRTTAKETLTDLLDLASQISLYSLDTENDARKNRPALIQIEFVNDEHAIVILVELFHLPPSDTHLFHGFISLFQSIFSSKNTIQTWGKLIDELLPFTIYGLFNGADIKQPVNMNVQDVFKSWYNEKHPHLLACLMHRSIETTYENFFPNDSHENNDQIDVVTQDDYRRCLCIERPYKFPSALWSLQLAIAYTTGQFLDKSNTISAWGLGLDRSLQRERKKFKERHRLNKLTYAVNDCFAVTKLARIIAQPQHPESLPRHQLRLMLTSLLSNRRKKQNHE